MQCYAVCAVVALLATVVAAGDPGQCTTQSGGCPIDPSLVSFDIKQFAEVYIRMNYGEVATLVAASVQATPSGLYYYLSENGNGQYFAVSQPDPFNLTVIQGKYNVDITLVNCVYTGPYGSMPARIVDPEVLTLAQFVVNTVNNNNNQQQQQQGTPPVYKLVALLQARFQPGFAGTNYKLAIQVVNNLKLAPHGVMIAEVFKLYTGAMQLLSYYFP
jgi:hypothetical protein